MVTSERCSFHREPTSDAVREWKEKTLQELRQIAEDEADAYERSRLQKRIARVERETLEMTIESIRRSQREEYQQRADKWKSLASDHRRYFDCTLENFQVTNEQQAEAIGKVREFVAGIDDAIDKGRGLLLYGPAGTGKTHLLAAVLRHVIMDVQRVSAVGWHRGVDLIGNAREALKNGRRILRSSPFRSPDEPCREIVAIDDPAIPGLQLQYEGLTRMYQAVNDCYEAGACLWVTCNCSSRDELDRLLTPPIADRIVDRSTPIFCNWPSHRKAG